MKKIVLSLHVTLDGYVAGPNGEMDWIKLDDEMFDLVNEFTNEADTALYGRITYEMMDAYWPTAADKPKATKHDLEHSNWYNNVEKIIVSKTLKGFEKDRTKVISNDLISEIKTLKEHGNKNIIIFGSPSIAKQLIAKNLVDVYWLFLNPVILGEGISFLPGMSTKINLEPVSTKVFNCGVTALEYHR